MASSVRRKQGYIYGTEAYAQYSAPQHRRQESYYEPKHHVRTIEEERTLRKNQEKALQIDLPYVAALTLAVVCVLYICVNYLHMQASITGRIHHIQTLEAQLENLKADNDALETRINTSVDLDRVYQIATEELGMVYANRNQVILYDKTESEYVRQYEDIPKH